MRETPRRQTLAARSGVRAATPSPAPAPPRTPSHPPSISPAHMTPVDTTPRPAGRRRPKSLGSHERRLPRNRGMGTRRHDPLQGHIPNGPRQGRELPHRRRELALLDDANAHVGRGHDGSAPFPATEQGELAEKVAGAQVGDHVVVSVYGGFAALG
jgi:hypothetical protein